MFGVAQFRIINYAQVLSGAGASEKSKGKEELPERGGDQHDDRPLELSFEDAVKLPVFWTTASGMLCAMWTYPAVLEQLQPALLAEGLTPTEAVSLVSAVATCGICGKLGSGFLSEKITARCTTQTAAPPSTPLQHACVLTLC